MDDSSYLTNVPLQHNCGGSIYIDMSRLYNFVATPEFKGGELTATYADFVQRKNAEYVLVCAECEEAIRSSGEVKGVCSLCYVVFEGNKLFKDKNVDRFYCTSCAEKHGKTIMPRTTVASLVNKFLKGDNG